MFWRLPPLASFEVSRRSSRNRLPGAKSYYMICRTKSEATSTRGEADGLPSVSTILYKQRSDRAHIVTTDAHRTTQRRKNEINVRLYIYVRTSVGHCICSRGTGNRIRRINSVRTYCLSDWLKIRQKQLNAIHRQIIFIDKSRCTWPVSNYKQVRCCCCCSHINSLMKESVVTQRCWSPRKIRKTM